MHADVTHLLLQAVGLPYEVSSSMTRESLGKAVLGLCINNQQWQAEKVPENENSLC